MIGRKRVVIASSSGMKELQKIVKNQVESEQKEKKKKKEKVAPLHVVDGVRVEKRSCWFG